MRVTSKRVIDAIECSHLELVKGPGYWYFVYDNDKQFETHSVYVMRLSDLSLTQWVQEGRQFLEAVAHRAENPSTFNKLRIL